jgi:hypothetical protein
MLANLALLETRDRQETLTPGYAIPSQRDLKFVHFTDGQGVRFGLPDGESARKPRPMKSSDY